MKKNIAVLSIVILSKYHILTASGRLMMKQAYFESAYYSSMVELQQKKIGNQSGFFLVGDSILNRISTTELNNCSIINLSIPGDTTHQLLKRIKLHKFKKHQQAFIMIGVNDIGTYVAPNQIVENIDSIITYLSPLIDKIFISTVLKTGALSRDNGHINHLNILLKHQFHHSEQVTIIDAHAMFNGQFSAPKHYTDDGLHLSEEGAAYLTAILREIALCKNNAVTVKESQ